MAPKSATGKPRAAAEHGTYKSMIRDAIFQLKERNGSSRQAIKKYIQANNKLGNADESTISRHVNHAISAGVKSGDFVQPKGASGTVKLAKPVPKVNKTPQAKSPKSSSAKKTLSVKTPNKTTATSKPVKKTSAVKKVSTATATTIKANDAKPRKAVKKTVTPSAASGRSEKSSSLTKTKSGRVGKSSAAQSGTKSGSKKAASKSA